MIQVGQDYTATFENITLTNAAQDLIELTAASGVPFVLTYAKVTTNQTTQVAGRIQILYRSAAGSGGTGVTPRAVSGGPTASTTVNRIVTTVGSAGNAMVSDAWNVVVPWEYDRRPGGLLIPAGSRIAVGLLAGVGTPAVSMTVEFTELK